ncbi:MAG: 2'-5' RNA ligase family protein [Ginsengibacter sp.]
MKPGLITTNPAANVKYDYKLNSDEQYEYLLMVNLGSEMNEKVKAEKQDFYKEYNVKTGIHTHPYIMIANFIAKEAMENTAIRWMENIFNNQQSFPVALNNYSGFPAHTIYLRVQDTKSFQKLAQELKVVNTYVNACGFPSMKLITHPHVSIAGSLPEEVYFKALTQYARKSFHESFMVNELLLLRRKNQYDTCKIIKVFALKSGNGGVLN